MLLNLNTSLPLPWGLEPDFVLILFSSVLISVAVGSFSRMVLCMADRPLPNTAQSYEFETNRRMQLRAGSTTYLWFEPLIDELAAWFPLPRQHSGGTFWPAMLGLNKVHESLLRRGSPLPWTSSEFLTVTCLKSFAMGTATLLAALFFFSFPTSLIFALLIFGFYFYTNLQRLHRDATRRLGQIKQRLPYAVDLMALMMEAGAQFRESLVTVVDATQNHPLGEEFGKVLADDTAGKPLHQALNELHERLRDEDITEITCATNNADLLGTPRSVTYLRLAEEMRLRRSQRAEREIGHAKTMLTFPGFLISMVCMLIVLAPFVIRAIEQSIF